MFQTCRPAGRLFYLVLAAVVVGAWSVRVSAREDSSAGKREKAASPGGETGCSRTCAAAASAPQSGPTLTSVVDTVYMANGSPAQGILVITWPAFVAADGTAVVPGHWM